MDGERAQAAIWLYKHQNDIVEDLNNLANGDKELLTVVKVDETGKPELTKEYLIAIGRPDMVEWGTDRQ